MDRLDHPGCEHHRALLYRRLVAGPHREDPRTSAGAGGDGGRLGDAAVRLRALAVGFDLGLCRYTRAAQRGAAAMMIAMMAVYLVLLFALVRFGMVTLNLFWKSSPFIVL